MLYAAFILWCLIALFSTIAAIPTILGISPKKIDPAVERRRQALRLKVDWVVTLAIIIAIYVAIVTL